MPQELEIKVGDVVAIMQGDVFRGAVGKVVAISGIYCKVWVTNLGQKGRYWNGLLSAVRRSYASPNNNTK